MRARAESCARSSRPAARPVATTDALARLRTAYAGLALALRHRDRGEFTRASRAIRTDEARLARALAGWQRAIRAA